MAAADTLNHLAVVKLLAVQADTQHLAVAAKLLLVDVPTKLRLE